MNFTTAIDLTLSLRRQETTATEIIARTLENIDNNPHLNCFTGIFRERAFRRAERIDIALAEGRHLPLAGVPFAVKNLFDVEGVITLAGSKINRDNPPATRDATAIEKLEELGAIAVGALNMDEYAYGFVTENHHYGVTPNPLDLTRVSGGSSGGSAATVAAGLVPISLGSDTNGSVRVPAACCGVLGLKPTYGRISRAGMYPFCNSLDHAGILARTVADLVLVYDRLQGYDPRDPVSSTVSVDNRSGESEGGLEGLRIAIAGDYFLRGADGEILNAVERVAAILGVRERVIIPEAERARAAAFIITAAEGANLHLKSLKTRLQDFDPATRDRFLAGALIPSGWYLGAQRFRVLFREILREVFRNIDIILTPTVPCVAPPIGLEKMMIGGEEVLVRPNLGRFTQPFSFIGLPALSYPLKSGDSLPAGLQIIAAPFQENKIFRVARFLEGRV